MLTLLKKNWIACAGASIVALFVLSLFAGWFITAVLGIVFGVAVHVGTRLVLGARADALPGGAFGAALCLSPWWIAIPFSLVGHYLSCVVCKRLWAKPTSTTE
jgi:hypothetical protein